MKPVLKSVLVSSTWHSNQQEACLVSLALGPVTVRFVMRTVMPTDSTGLLRSQLRDRDVTLPLLCITHTVSPARHGHLLCSDAGGLGWDGLGCPEFGLPAYKYFHTLTQTPRSTHCTYTSACTHTHIYSHTFTRSFTHAHIYTHSDTYTLKHLCIHACVHTRARALLQGMREKERGRWGGGGGGGEEERGPYTDKFITIRSDVHNHLHTHAHKHTVTKYYAAL